MQDSRHVACLSDKSADGLKKPVPVAIAGRQPLLREGVKQIYEAFELEFNFEINVSQTYSVEEIFDFCTVPDILVLFKHIGDACFYKDLELWLNLAGENRPKVVVISETIGKSDWEVIDRFVVDLFLPMKVETYLVKQLLLSVFSKDGFQRELFLKCTAELQKDFMPDILDLSGRELRVMSYLQHGMCNKDIAIQMNVAVPTVKSYMYSISKKLGVSGRLNVALVAYRQLQPLFH